MRIAEAFMVLVEVFEHAGKKWDGALPGCLEHRIDEHWTVALNGAKEPRKDAEGGEVPRFHALIRYDGFPVGLVSPAGGSLIADPREKPGAAERRFIKACRASLPPPAPRPAEPSNLELFP